MTSSVPVDPVQAEFQALYPPHIWWTMDPVAQAQAWAQFLHNRQVLVNQARTRRTVNALIVWLVVLPAILGLAVVIAVAVTGHL